MTAQAEQNKQIAQLWRNHAGRIANIEHHFYHLIEEAGVAHDFGLLSRLRDVMLEVLALELIAKEKSK
jgi:hypothetical protein